MKITVSITAQTDHKNDIKINENSKEIFQLLQVYVIIFTFLISEQY